MTSTALRLPLGGHQLARGRRCTAARCPALRLGLGHEGQGVAPEVQARCALQLRIPQPGGEESLNVAAAAASACTSRPAPARG
jgi:tRNA(Leu) C34 or U34 (ribose-2'-O)-methylase TrmL